MSFLYQFLFLMRLSPRHLMSTPPQSLVRYLTCIRSSQTSLVFGQGAVEFCIGNANAAVVDVGGDIGG